MPHATLVVRGRIATLAGDDGPGWVEAIGIAGGRVVAAGSLGDVDAASGPGARLIDLGPDEAAVPGGKAKNKIASNGHTFMVVHHRAQFPVL